jgi:hypothetical protein
VEVSPKWPDCTLGSPPSVGKAWKHGPGDWVFRDSRVLDNPTRRHSAPWARPGVRGGAGGAIVAIAQFGPGRLQRKHLIQAILAMEGHPDAILRRLGAVYSRMSRPSQASL